MSENRTWYYNWITHELWHSSATDCKPPSPDDPPGSLGSCQLGYFLYKKERPWYKHCREMFTTWEARLNKIAENWSANFEKDTK